jgi:hypothetical protein
MMVLGFATLLEFKPDHTCDPTEASNAVNHVATLKVQALMMSIDGGGTDYHFCHQNHKPCHTTLHCRHRL